MKKIVKQVVGVDVAQKELVVSLGRMFDDWIPEFFASKTFPNTRKGFENLVSWTRKQMDNGIAARYVMEATGVYHESFAYFLDEKGQEVSIVLPNKISNYMRTLEVKTVTDKTAAEAIARFGLERHLEKWEKPKGTYRTIKQLTRERDQIVEERSIAKNHLHAENSEAFPNKSTLGRINDRIKFLNKQEKAIKDEIAGIVSNDEEAKENVALVASVSGLGTLTAAIILGETNGFEHIRNRRQLTSYAGFDVKEKQSGTSIKKKPKMSKKGNKQLRKAMHLPALSAIKHDQRFTELFARLVARDGIKMKAVVAVQRKLLEMAYTVYKTRKSYDKNYSKENEQIKATKIKGAAIQDMPLLLPG